MSYDGLLLTIHTALHRYVARRDQILELRTIIDVRGMEHTDERGKPLTIYELGPMLDPRDEGRSLRRHALIVPTRRRSVALLVDRVDDFQYVAPGTVQALAPLLARRLARPWVLGVAIRDDTPLLILDLRQIAQDALTQTHVERRAV